MLGHRLVLELQPHHEVVATFHGKCNKLMRPQLFSQSPIFIENVDVCDFGNLIKIVNEKRPEAIINAAGIVKQRRDALDPILSLDVNSIFPKLLANLCSSRGLRLIHFSTDCVFSGERGLYKETDIPDPIDLYGRTKLLGEVDKWGCLTIRSSLIGIELGNKLGLVEWFLSMRGNINGHVRGIFSGLTTASMARLILRLLATHSQLDGIWHVSSVPISKHQLLLQLAMRLRRRDIVITPNEEFRCDRSLDSSAFRSATSWEPESWDSMIDELATLIEKRQNQGSPDAVR